MMIEAQVANVAWTATSIVLLWATGRYLLIPAIRDTLRHRLFSIRREMFLFMAKGGISAEQPAYGHVRSFINSAIRHADSFSLGRTILGVAVAGEFGKERTREVEALIASLPPDAKNQLQKFRQQSALALGAYAIVRSPLGWLLSLIAVPVVGLVALRSLVRSASAKPWARARQALTRRAEQETQILKCIDEDSHQHAAAA
jgi:hypothetical protein